MKSSYESEEGRRGDESVSESDVQLTAYALGELEGDERAAVEARLATDGAARRFVADMRMTAQDLELEFAGEQALALSAEQRSRIADSARRPRRPRQVARAALAAGIFALGAFAAYRSIRGVREDMPLAAIPPGPAEGRDLLAATNSRTLDVPGQRPKKLSGDPGGDPGIYFDSGEDGDFRATTQNHFDAFSREASESLEDAAELVSIEVGDSTAIGVGAPGRHGSARSRGRASEIPKLRGVGYAVDSEQGEGHNTEGYNAIAENVFKLTTQDPLSTFAIDVDTASYANLRRFLNEGTLPPVDAIRIEEMLNYFRFEYPRAEGGAPFSTSATVAACPWAPTHKLVQVGLRAQDIDVSKRPHSNLVFLVDVSGSMQDANKLPLLVKSMRLLVEQLDGRDRVAIVVYAGASGLVLPSTTCDYKTVILNALESLQAGGSTNGAAGIELAYQIATQNKLAEGQNRVILCTDGDFNVGITDQGSLVRLIEEKRASGIFLSVLGYGTGNTKDSTMEMLADKGNGNYAYIDGLAEARKVLVTEMGGTLFTVAKDVKIQVEFNPSEVQAWRLIGYENRQLAHQDFNDDKKDAGEIGAGHNVTALYEVVPVGVPFTVPGVDPLRYQVPPQTTGAASSSELLNLKLRYKAPDGDTSKLLETPIANTSRSWQEATPDFKFAAAVAGFGMVLRKSPNAGSFTLKDVENLALQGIGEDVGGYRKEFLELVRRAQTLQR